MNMRVKHLKARLAVFSCLASLGFPLQADHSWSIYHWATQSHPITLITTNSMTNEWQDSFNGTISRWSQSAVFAFDVVAGSTSNKVRRRCNPKDGQIVACNLNYGNNGWLGLAGINIDNAGHIVRGYAKMNDYYDWYWTPEERNHVVCQEVGHLFGLGHTSEDGSSQGTCMDYSSSPASQWPNAHDYDMLDQIYAHLDDYDSWDTGGSGGGGGGNGGCNAPPGKGCNKFGFDLENGPPMGIPVQVGLHHEIWVARDGRGGYWIHHVTIAPGGHRAGGGDRH
jgi:hypothetical protein